MLQRRVGCRFRDFELFYEVAQIVCTGDFDGVLGEYRLEGLLDGLLEVEANEMIGLVF